MEVALLHVWKSGHSVSDAVYRSWSRMWPDAELHTATITTTQSWEKGAERLEPRIGLDGGEDPILLPMVRNYDLILSTSPEASREFPHCRGRRHFCFLSNSSDPQIEVPQRVDVLGDAFSRHRFSHPLRATRRVYPFPWSHETCRLPEQVTHWISASRAVRELNNLASSMQSLVLYPPIDTKSFRPLGLKRENFYLSVCRNRVIEGLPMALAACEKIGRKFLIAAPPEIAEQIPKGLRKHVEPYHKESALAAWYNRCSGVIIPGIVDYDPTILESQACGAPVIALGEGGALEMVIDAEECRQGTGIFFEEPDVASLVSALEELERRPNRCSAALGWCSAAAYSETQFEKRTVRLLREVLNSEEIRSKDRRERGGSSINQRRDAA